MLLAGGYVCRLANDGPTMQRDLLRALQVERATLSVVVGTLVRKGLVEQVLDRVDQRQKLLRMTRAGVRRWEKLPDLSLIHKTALWSKCRFAGASDRYRTTRELRGSSGLVVWPSTGLSVLGLGFRVGRRPVWRRSRRSELRGSGARLLGTERFDEKGGGGEWRKDIPASCSRDELRASGSRAILRLGLLRRQGWYLSRYQDISEWKWILPRP